MADFVNFSRWIQRLGFTTNVQPEYTYAVQPISVARDETDLVSPAVGSRATAGAFRIGGAGNFSGTRLRNQGGGWIAGRLTQQSAAQLELTIPDNGSLLAYTASTAMPVVNENSQLPTTAIAECGDLAAIPAGGTVIPGISTAFLSFDFWLEPGHTAQFVQRTAAGVGTYSLSWVEYPPEP